MNFKTSKLLATAMMLLVNIAIFAQPNPDPDGTDLNPEDAPIDSSLIILLAVGLVYVAYKFFAKKQLAK